MGDTCSTSYSFFDLLVVLHNSQNKGEPQKTLWFSIIWTDGHMHVKPFCVDLLKCVCVYNTSASLFCNSILLVGYDCDLNLMQLGCGHLSDVDAMYYMIYAWNTLGMISPSFFKIWHDKFSSKIPT